MSMIIYTDIGRWSRKQTAKLFQYWPLSNSFMTHSDNRQ